MLLCAEKCEYLTGISYSLHQHWKHMPSIDAMIEALSLLYMHLLGELIVSFSAIRMAIQGLAFKLLVFVSNAESPFTTESSNDNNASLMSMLSVCCSKEDALGKALAILHSGSLDCSSYHCWPAPLELGKGSDITLRHCVCPHLHHTGPSAYLGVY